MSKFTKKLLTGVVALGLLTPVAIQTVNQPTISVQAKTKSLPHSLRGTWKSSHRLHGYKIDDLVTIHHHSMNSDLRAAEHTVNGNWFNHVKWHLHHHKYYLTARCYGESGGPLPHPKRAYIQIKRYRGHIKYREHVNGMNMGLHHYRYWSKWTYMY